MPSEPITPAFICLAYSSVNSYFLTSEGFDAALTAGVLDLSSPATKALVVKLLFSLSPDVPGSAVLVDPIGTSLVSNSEEGLF